MRKTLGLALGSGGSRGIAHIGFLQALEEENIKADFVTGCSMGAIVGACYCAGVPMEQLKERAMGLRLSQIASLNLAPMKANGLFRLNKAHDLLTELIGEKTFDELDIPFCCVAVDLVAGQVVQLKEGTVVDCALASSSIPGAFTPARIGEKIFVDGGILERVPVEPLQQMGADVIVAVDVLGDLRIKKVSLNPVSVLLRCIDIMDTNGTKRRKEHSVGADLWLEPELGAMDQYKIKELAFAYEKGYEIGKANCQKIKSLIEGN